MHIETTARNVQSLHLFAIDEYATASHVDASSAIDGQPVDGDAIHKFAELSEHYLRFAFAIRGLTV